MPTTPNTPKTTPRVAGLDVGGVHVKAALVEGGRIADVFQAAAPTMSGLAVVRAAIEAARDRLAPAGRTAVTITAELADAFPSRRDGVLTLAAMLGEVLGPEALLYGGRAGFLPLAAAGDHVADIASANWHATARIVAKRQPDALLADIGSTTTDLIPIAGGALTGRGYGDAERIVAGELLYTGTTRSFVMAIADRVPFEGVWQPLMNEYFASMADVRRITGELDEATDQQATADGRGKSVAESRARLARMLGRDAADAGDDAWLAVACWLGERQLRAIHDAAAQVISAGRLAADAPVVGAGIGDFLARALADRLGRRFIAFADLLPADPVVRDWASRAAPAAAVALLAADLGG